MTTISQKPPLETLISLADVEDVAKSQLDAKAWAYFSSGATDCVTRDMNLLMYKRIWFRPRLLKNVSVVDTRTRILGCESALPLYIAPVGFAALAHPEGEVAMMRACARKTIPMCVRSTFQALEFF